jgi:AraC family transcriptional activator of pyochelin receptor
MGKVKHASGQPPLDPGKMLEATLPGIPQEWQPAVKCYQPGEGLSLSHISGRPGSQWAFEAEGSPAFSLSILLEGRMQAAFDNGSVLDARSGSAVIMATGQHTSGWDVLDGRSDGAFRMVSIHMPEDAMLNLTGLRPGDLRKQIVSVRGNQSHVDAFLGGASASGTLRRIATELIGFERTCPPSCLSRDLYLRAKALEAMACFLREYVTPPQARLRVPADRTLLLEARALLEKEYGQAWTVQSLSRHIGLNEKRLQSGFHALFGAPVHACLIRIRLEAAMALLQQGMNVTETAAQCGFGSLSHFSRAFREYTGVSPKKFQG